MRIIAPLHGSAHFKIPLSTLKHTFVVIKFDKLKEPQNSDK